MKKYIDNKELIKNHISCDIIFKNEEIFEIEKLKNLIHFMDEKFNKNSFIKKYYIRNNNFFYDSQLLAKTGHLKYYRDNLFLIETNSKKKEFFLKPMNCPTAILMYIKKLKNFKLPLQMFEFGRVFRKEKSGNVNTTDRFNSFVIDDSHIFCNKDHIKQIVEFFIKKTKLLYKLNGLDNISYELSTIPKKILLENNNNNINNIIEEWKETEDLLMEIIKKNRDSIENFKIDEGEGSFYGSKIDIKSNNLQLGSIQLDFRAKINFNLKENIYIMHSASLGSIERFYLKIKNKKKAFFLKEKAYIILIYEEIIREKNLKEFLDSIIFLQNHKFLNFDIYMFNNNLNNIIKKYRKKTNIFIIIGEEIKKNKINIKFINYGIKDINNLINYKIDINKTNQIDLKDFLNINKTIIKNILN